MSVCLFVPCVTCLGRLASWLSLVVSNCEFVVFPIGILGQVWYLIVSIPDLCTFTYLSYIIDGTGMHKNNMCTMI